MLKFSFAGIPVSVQPWFWILAVVLGLSNRITGAGLPIWVAVVFVSVLIHELGHAFTVRRVGYRPFILLHFIGGLTTWYPNEELEPRPRVLTTLAGPFAGFALAGVAWLLLELTGIGDTDSLQRDSLVWLLVVNLIWGIFNLVPVRGLDGGQALRAMLEIASPAYGSRIAEVVYVIVGLGAIAFGLIQGYVILAIFAAIMTFGGYMPARPRPRAAQEDAGEPKLGI